MFPSERWTGTGRSPGCGLPELCPRDRPPFLRDNPYFFESVTTLREPARLCAYKGRADPSGAPSARRLERTPQMSCSLGAEVGVAVGSRGSAADTLEAGTLEPQIEPLSLVVVCAW